MWRLRLETQKPSDEVPAPAAEISAAVRKDGVIERPSVMNAMHQISNGFMAEFVGARPHADLSILVTHPEHQRRGAGSMLVGWGCQKADERGLMCILTASEAGLPVYKKHGFVVVKEVPLDLRPFGIDETELICLPHATIRLLFLRWLPASRHPEDRSSCSGRRSILLKSRRADRPLLPRRYLPPALSQRLPC
ncbi:hypothetical protein EJ03DRAFT_325276 [Teratosphaeria nubilosa]|uniref:N-acetyltransferase domain-containing protein n=1 Tax=Teratosphaeria nubilosa TaxID=161662 RepID=A0A6G1LG83_9PEZI|nr:hypothetical protein EJ03DRAFT_325276 [Teratosphaeria nubilosa]